VAVERIVAGLEKKRRILSAKEREIVAHHETGARSGSALAVPADSAAAAREAVQRGRPPARSIARVRTISEATFAPAVSILTSNSALVEEGARQLLQKETLTEDEIGTIAATLKRPA
jgi:ATP-dependent Zn protease